jgi:uncharacterized damage-inducible protein DinB
VEPREVQKFFDYLIDSRARFLDTFRSLGWDEFGRDRGASWGSMLNIFLHLLDVEEGWLQYGARGRPIQEGPDRSAAAYSNFEAVAADNERVGAGTREFLRRLTGDDLARELEVPHGAGKDRRTVERIVLHAWVDEVAHLGELVGLLWQVGREPPYLDWLDYRQVHDHGTLDRPRGPAP